MNLGAEVLHIYGQAFWHGEAYIGGGRAAMLALRDAIQRALDEGQDDDAGCASCDVFASDGEGYTVHVVVMEHEAAERQVVPYSDDVARQPWNGAFGPWDVLRGRL